MLMIKDYTISPLINKIFFNLMNNNITFKESQLNCKFFLNLTIFIANTINLILF